MGRAGEAVTGVSNSKDFETLWPPVERRLRSVLYSRRVRSDAIDDLAQETALRILRRWDDVEPETIGAYAVTIATNLLRDEARRSQHSIEAAALRTEDAPPADRLALARIQLRAVGAALSRLNPTQRAVLIAEVDPGETVIPIARSAIRMARMRARTRLRELLESSTAMGGLAQIKMRRVFSMQEPISGSAFAAANMLAAVVMATGVMGAPATTAQPTGSGGLGDFQVTASRVSTPEVRGAEAIDPISDLGQDGLDWAARLQSWPEARPEMNSNFGPVHAGEGQLYVGGWGDVGPYGADKSYDNGVTAIRGRAVYEPSGCVKRTAWGAPPSKCTSFGKLEVKATVRAGGQSHDVGTEKDLRGDI